jgi:filamentous hemagglutinin family protein
MQRCLWPCSTSLLVIYFLLSSSCPVSAHPLPDNTLGAESSIVTPIRQNFDRIAGGALRGSNLFHSFQRFDIQTGHSAYFSAPEGVANIFSRVTGSGSPSSINGRLGSSGTANLFFLNPNGIIFGPSATLDLKGSFIASTASSVLFPSGERFSATAPRPIPLLTIDSVAPIGLVFEGNPSGISVERSATESFDLTVQPGKTLALIGGDIRLSGNSTQSGTLRALGGRVELGGLAESGVVQLSNNLQELHLLFPPNKIRSDVSLANGAQVITRSNNGGSISVHARNLELTKSSKFVGGINVLESTSDAKAGNITIDATGEVILRGGSVIANDFDEVTRAEPTSFLHQAGDIQITADILSLSQDSVIVSSTRGRGNAGSLIIDTNKIDADRSYLLSTVGRGAIGNGGNIQITTGTLDIIDKSVVSVGVEGSLRDNEQVSPEALIIPGNGNAGRLSINASKSININDSYILSALNKDATGAGGNITIETASLALSNHALLSASTGGQGNAGRLSINASNQIDVTSGSEILSDVGGSAVGQGGKITIDTGSLTVSDRALLSTGSEGEGSAGPLSINARDKILIDNAQVNSTLEFGQGSGGTVRIDTGSLTIANNGELAVSTEGPNGNAGDLNINANSVYLLNQGVIRANTESGNGGDINLTIRDIVLLRKHSTITTTAGTVGSKGDGGNITINTQRGFIVAAPSENSDITANAFSGKGGQVLINARSIFGLSPRSRSDLEILLSTSNPTELNPEKLSTSEITAISQQNPTLNGQVDLNASINPSQNLNQVPKEPRSTDIADSCQVSNGKESVQFFDIGRGGLPPRPEDPLSIDLLEWSPPTEAKVSPSGETSHAERPSPDLLSHAVQSSTAPLRLLPPCQSH